MGPYRDLFVDAEDAIERERHVEAYRLRAEALRKWYDWYPPGHFVDEERRDVEWLAIEARICAYVRLGIARLPLGFALGLSDL